MVGADSRFWTLDRPTNSSCPPGGDRIAGGGFCVGVSKAALKEAGASAGDEVELSIEPVTRP